MKNEEQIYEEISNIFSGNRIPCGQAAPILQPEAGGRGRLRADRFEIRLSGGEYPWEQREDGGSFPCIVCAGGRTACRGRFYTVCRSTVCIEERWHDYRICLCTEA